jgi:hypothetical protein
MDLFPSSAKKMPIQMGLLQRGALSQWMGKDAVLETLCSLSFRILHNGQTPQHQ